MNDWSYFIRNIRQVSQKIANLRDQGKTFREIGKELDMSAARAEQIYKRYLSDEKLKQSSKLDPKANIVGCLYEAQRVLDLDPRIVTSTYRHLFRLGYFKTGYDDPRIFDLSDEQLLSIRYFGLKSLKLVRTAQDIYYQRNGLI